MDCFVSVEQFSGFQFLLQQMLHIQDHPVQKNISDPVSFNEVTSLHYSSYTTYTFGACLKKNILRKKVYAVPAFK